MARFPEAPFRLVVGGGTGLALSNPKVERLVAAARAARGDIFFVSDSNVRVEPGDVAATVAAFDDPAVGCVSNVFTGSGARSFGAVIESLHLLTFVLPGTVLAAAGGVACVVGKSMALPPGARRDRRLRRVHDVLAEDQAIGCAVKAAGFRIALSTVVVRNVTVRRALGRALDRQARWGKIRLLLLEADVHGRAPPQSASRFPSSPAAARRSGPPASPPPFAAAGALLLLRLAQGFVLARAAAPTSPRPAPSPPRQGPPPARDAGGPYVSREVDWNGHRARLGPGRSCSPPAAPRPPPERRSGHQKIAPGIARGLSEWNSAPPDEHPSRRSKRPVV